MKTTAEERDNLKHNIKFTEENGLISTLHAEIIFKLISDVEEQATRITKLEAKP